MAQDPEDLEFLQVAAATVVDRRGDDGPRPERSAPLTLVTAWSKRTLHRRRRQLRPGAWPTAHRPGPGQRRPVLGPRERGATPGHGHVDARRGDHRSRRQRRARLCERRRRSPGWVSLAPQELLEATEQELMERLEVWAEDGTRLDRDLIAERFRTGRLPTGRAGSNRGSRPAARSCWAVVSSEPINAPDGRLLYAVTTIEDVTELKRSEFTQQLLARAGELLGASIDYRADGPSSGAAWRCPQFADWCSVSIPDESGDPATGGHLRHRDPAERRLGDSSPERQLPGAHGRATRGWSRSAGPRLGRRGPDDGGRKGRRGARVRRRPGVTLVRRRAT